MMQKNVWLAISYNVPISPSKARVYVWRKLKACGAEYLRPGVALLPNSSQNLQVFNDLAQKIRQMGGEAILFDMRYLEAADEQELTTRFRAAVQQEYQSLLSDCALTLHALRAQPLTRQENEKIRRMVERYCRTRARDQFKAGIATREIEQGLSELVEGVRGVTGELGRQLRALLDSV